MVLTKIYVALLLVTIMSRTLAAPDQTAGLEKSNENGDAQDVFVVLERLERTVGLENDDENGDLQHLNCLQKYIYCSRLFDRRCLHACLFQFQICRRYRRVQDAEGSVQDALVTSYQPAKFEEETESGDVQRVPKRLCYEIYNICTNRFRFCRIVCLYHYH